MEERGEGGARREKGRGESRINKMGEKRSEEEVMGRAEGRRGERVMKCPH